MRAERGRRSSPQQRGMDRRYPAANGARGQPDRRRPRSISPRGGRSPPPYHKRLRGQEGAYEAPPGRFGEYDRDFDAAYEDPRGNYAEHYTRASPRYTDSRSTSARVVKSYKTFMLELPDEITPEEAQKKYDEYLTVFWGSARKSHFQSIKDKPETRARFDPREQAKGLKTRNEEAHEAAQKFSERLLSGGLNPASKDFNQGEGASDSKNADTVMGDTDAEQQGDANGSHVKQVAPALLWKPERVAADLKFSRQLIEKLDQEKGITSNPLIAADELHGTPTEEDAKKDKPAAGDAAAEPANAGAEPDAAAPSTDAEMPQADKSTNDGDATSDGPSKTDYQTHVKTDEKSAAVSDDQDRDASTHQKTTEVKIAAQVEEATEDGSSSGAVGKLDVHLTYLWEVHRVNYYVGGEWWDPCDRERWATTSRMLRAPHPEEGEQPDAEQEKLESAQVKKMVDQVWQARMSSGDPLEALLHTEQIEKEVDQWVADKVVKHSDTKWGNSLSTKMFVGQDFVLKHIRTKHGEKVEEFKSQRYEELYWQNYDTMESNRIELAKQARREALQAAEAANKEEELEVPMELQQGSGFFPGLGGKVVGDDEQAGSGEHANGVQRAGSGLRNGSKPRGGGRSRQDRNQGPMRHGSMGMNAPMAGPMGSVMGGMQAMPGQMFVLAPGAGPLGPFVQIPIPAGGHPPLDMGAQMAGGPPRGNHRGGRAPRNQHGGRGFGGPMHPMGGRGINRGYFDLDAPENQRGVLDYGDL